MVSAPLVDAGAVLALLQPGMVVLTIVNRMVHSADEASKGDCGEKMVLKMRLFVAEVILGIVGSDKCRQRNVVLVVSDSSLR